MGTWVTQTTMDGAPAEVLDVLTDPRACTRWSPIDFDIDATALPRRLIGGTRTRVAGRLAGCCVDFSLEVLASDHRGLSMRASGPIEIDVDYEVRPVDKRSEVRARIEVTHSGGLTGRLLSRATDVLLAGGMLDRALEQIALEARPARSHSARSRRAARPA